jgi:outer membrane protein OmpA-like peptidoglycan-associated protein
MAYVRIGENESTLGSFGCGPGCSCAGCRQTAGSETRLGERYVPEAEETTPSPEPRPAPAPPPRSNLSGWGRFGEPLPQRRLSPTGLQLRMPAFATLTGFARGGASLNAAQLERVKRAAEFIVQSWRGTSPITSIRITGYIDANEEQSDLGQRRAVTVRDALHRALGSAQPGLATRLRWIVEDRGFSPVAKVEIYLWHGTTAPPVPPLVRVPSPAEAARKVTPMHGSFGLAPSTPTLTPALRGFLNQVRNRPQDFKKLLLIVALHPDPAESRIWARQSFTFDKKPKNLQDEILLSGHPGQAKVVVRDVLMQIARANFKQEIDAEWRRSNELINTARGLGYALLSPFIMDPLLLPDPPDPRKLCKLALEFAQKMLPQDLVRGIMNSEVSEAHLTSLGQFLRVYAKDLQRTDKHFRKLVEIARKWQREGKWLR